MATTHMARKVLNPALAFLAFLTIAARPGTAAAAPGSLCNTPSASPDCVGATFLPDTLNMVHYKLQPGAVIVSKIIGATDLTGSESCTSGPAGVDVIIKSTDFGNQTVCGSLSGCPGAGCTITFNYTAPNGPSICACNTSIVAYKTSGNNSNNDVIDDGSVNASGGNPAGFAYVDSQGQTITTCGCPTTTTTSTTSTSSSSSTSSTTSTSTSSSTSSTTSTSTSSSTSTTETTTSTTETTTTSTTSTSSFSSTSSTTSTSTSSSTSTTETTTSTTATSTSSTTSTMQTTTTTTSTSTTSTTIVLDHFQCYELKPAFLPPTTVTEQDQFGTQTLTLRYPHRLCAPANKNGEGIIDPVQHLTGYDTLRTPFTRQSDLTIVNQFGTIVIDLTKRDVLMVPTAKSLTQPPAPLQPPTIDHFQCYRAKRGKGQPRFTKINATVIDQFENVTITLTRPYRLCVPTNKNGEDPTAPGHATKLLCYKVRSGTAFGTLVANINNQFGSDDVTLIHRRELCVPSLLY